MGINSVASRFVSNHLEEAEILFTYRQFLVILGGVHLVDSNDEAG